MFYVESEFLLVVAHAAVWSQMERLTLHPFRDSLGSRLPLMTRLQCILIGSLPSPRCRGMQAAGMEKQRVAPAVPTILFSLRYHFPQLSRLSCLIPCTALSLGIRVVAAFQCRSLKLDFQGVVAVLMLPSLGGNETNPAFLTTAEILPAASKQLS